MLINFTGKNCVMYTYLNNEGGVMSTDKMFYCHGCLITHNIGKHIDNIGDCDMCHLKNTDGNWVTPEDISKAELFGKDDAGLFWKYTLPAFNSCYPADSICPCCGHNVFDRHTAASTYNHKYSCNNCGTPLQIRVLPNDSYAYVDTVEQLKAWLKHHKVIAKPGDFYMSDMYGKIQLITDRKTMFFIDKNHRVAGYMVDRPAFKGRTELGISQPVIDRMFGSYVSYDTECQWEYR